MAEIIFENVVKKYGKTEVVHGINLTVKDGEFMVFVGPSGCAKSTNLRMVAGLEEISDGKIYIDGQCVNDIPPQHRDLAMVFQNYALYPHKTVAENIVFGLLKKNLPKEEVEKRLQEVAQALQLEEYLDRKPAALSGGQRQRVAMGRAIARDAKAFLFDEPLSNLDAKLRHSMRAEIRKLHRHLKTTTIYVTHDQIEAMTLADRICVLKDGNIEQVGTPMELYLNPENIFVATFIGSPAMNILDAQLTKTQLHFSAGLILDLTDVQKTFAEKYLNGAESRPVKVGIRPDFVQDKLFSAEAVDIGAWPIDMIEPLGFEREFLINLGEQKLLARLDLRTQTQEGELIQLTVDMTQIHLFDPETTININRL